MLIDQKNFETLGHYPTFTMKLKTNDMKNFGKVLMGGLLLTAAASCSSPDYGPSADAMCECMTTKDAERDPDALLGADFDYASCAFEVILSTRTDINNADFGKVLGEKCSQYSALHADYLKTISE